jgi:hypothetical protein
VNKVVKAVKIIMLKVMEIVILEKFKVEWEFWVFLGRNLQKI